MYSNIMKQLNILELHKNINEKANKRKQYFTTVLEKCHSKIRRASEKELYECIYDVPEFVVGLPVYKITDCIIFLFENLKENGFNVKYHYPKFLYISWKPVNVDKYILDKNTINVNNYDELLFNTVHKQHQLEHKQHTKQLDFTNHHANTLNSSNNSNNHNSKEFKKKQNGKFVLNLY